jgi:hypothetical protein
VLGGEVLKAGAMPLTLIAKQIDAYLKQKKL